MNLDHRFIAFPFYNRTYVTIITPPFFFMITRPNIIFSELAGVKYRQEICVPGHSRRYEKS